MSLVLYDTSTTPATEIREIHPGDALDLATLRSTSLSIRAVTSPSRVGSVKFAMTSNQRPITAHIENHSPYFLNGKTSVGGIYPYRFQVGQYALTVSVYAFAQAIGGVKASSTLHFSVVHSSNVPLIPTPPVTPLVRPASSNRLTQPLAVPASGNPFNASQYFERYYADCSRGWPVGWVDGYYWPTAPGNSDYSGHSSITHLLNADGSSYCAFDLQSYPSANTASGYAKGHANTAGHISYNNNTFVQGQIRIGLPGESDLNHAYPGIWAAFWSMTENPSDPTNPVNPEFDIFELLATHGQANYYNMTIHPFMSSRHFDSTDFSDDHWHTFGFQYDPDHLYWFVDGRQVLDFADRSSNQLSMAIQNDVDRSCWGDCLNTAALFPQNRHLHILYRNIQIFEKRGLSKDPVIAP